MSTIYEVERNGEVIKVKKCTSCLCYKSVESFRFREGRFYNGACIKCEREYNKNRRRKIRSGEN